MEFPGSQFYIALSESLTPDDAYNLLDRLAHDEELREAVQKNPRDALLAVGIDVGEELAPSEAVLPPPEEIEKALETFSTLGAFRFELVPFGPFTPGRAPFKAGLMLAARANQPGS